MSNEEILFDEFVKLKNELIAAYDRKGMRSSGRWASALEVEAGKTFGRVTGLEYTEQLEYGRSSGKRPPVSVIEDWIVEKGLDLQIENDITISGLAYIIARKIGNEGWDREGFGGVDLVSEVVTPSRIQRILDRLASQSVENLIPQIVGIFRNS